MNEARVAGALASIEAFDKIGKSLDREEVNAAYEIERGTLRRKSMLARLKRRMRRLAVEEIERRAAMIQS